MPGNSNFNIEANKLRLINYIMLCYVGTSTITENCIPGIGNFLSVITILLASQNLVLCTNLLCTNNCKAKLMEIMYVILMYYYYEYISLVLNIVLVQKAFLSCM